MLQAPNFDEKYFPQYFFILQSLTTSRAAVCLRALPVQCVIQVYILDNER